MFEANRDEMEYVVRKSGPAVDTSTGDGMLRMRGLPFGCSKEEIVQFFMGMMSTHSITIFKIYNAAIQNLGSASAISRNGCRPYLSVWPF